MSNVTALQSKALTIPNLPRSVASLLAGESFWNGTDVVERSWSATPVPASDRADAETGLAELNKYLAPSNREWLAGRVLTLLSHFYTPDMPEQLHRAVGQDWVDALGEFPRHAVESACREYLSRDSRYRPTPGQIAALAGEVCGKEMKQRDRLSRCLALEVGERERERGGVKSVGVTMEEALATSARAKELLRNAPDP